MKEIQFNGKVAVITGAASGMGLYSAKEFVRLGAKVIMCDVNEAALMQAAAEIGEAAVPVCGDVRECACDGACGRRVGAWLYDGGVSCRDGIGKRVKRQQKGIVPRAHDQRIAVRDRLLETAGSKLCERRTHFLSFRKTLNVAKHIRNFVQY